MNTVAVRVATILCAMCFFVSGYFARGNGSHQPMRPITACLPVDAGTPPTASDRSTVRWGAEDDVIDFVMTLHIEPRGLVTCYFRRAAMECPVRFDGGIRWAVCRPRATTEHETDGRRCWWAGDAGR